MKNTNNYCDLLSCIVVIFTELLAKALIKQAEQGVKHSMAFFMSEPNIGHELIESEQN
ncbi:MAG: hypothetical protein FWC16_09495 [Defluviitaleaceae bacterium]|nr:hypothetical protein [Defluviitaleaceae bacterium]MCL2275146.1 hypothetical protein [Defluviitaleaceae bacterium]